MTKRGVYKVKSSIFLNEHTDTDKGDCSKGLCGIQPQRNAALNPKH